MCHQHADVLTMKLPKLGPDGLRFHGAPRNAGSTLPKWVYFESGGLWECFFFLFLDAKAEEQSADNIEEIDCV